MENRFDDPKTLGRHVLLGSAAMLFVAGCTGQVYTEPVASPGPSPVYAEGPPAPPPPPPPAPGPVMTTTEADVVYAPEPPVVDVEAYPSVVFGGVPVYYVGGMWYRHDSAGWGYYRQEPPELARNRAEHERDPRWVQARQVRPRPPARPGIAAPQAPPPPRERDRR